jgi:branched-chain amino acid transport system permease protein
MAFYNIRTKYNALTERQQSLILASMLVVPVIFVYLYAFNFKTEKAAFLLNDTIIWFLVFFIAALSLDMEVGSLGLPNFGKVAFIALGAYITTIVLNLGFFKDVFLDFFAGVIIAMLVSAFFGWLIAIPSVKLRADYFAIMTIAGGEIIRLLLQNEKRYFWTKTDEVIGPNGEVIPLKEPLMLSSFKQSISQWNLFGINLGDQFTLNFGKFTLIDFNIGDFKLQYILDLNLGSVNYFQIFIILFMITFALGIYFFVQIIRASPYGRVLRAIREDDITVTSVGKDVFKFRWQIAVLAAIVASISGSLFSILSASFEPLDFRPKVTFNLFVFIIIGGIGNSRGVAFGTFLIAMFLRATEAESVKSQLNFTVDETLPFIGKLLTDLQFKLDISAENIRFVILGSILILFLLYKPGGVIPEPKSNNEKYLRLLTAEERRDSDDAIGRRQSSAEKDRISNEDESRDLINFDSEELK